MVWSSNEMCIYNKCWHWHGNKWIVVEDMQGEPKKERGTSAKNKCRCLWVLGSYTRCINFIVKNNHYLHHCSLPWCCFQIRNGNLWKVHNDDRGPFLGNHSIVVMSTNAADQPSPSDVPIHIFSFHWIPLLCGCDTSELCVLMKRAFHLAFDNLHHSYCLVDGRSFSNNDDIRFGLLLTLITGS